VRALEPVPETKRASFMGAKVGQRPGKTLKDALRITYTF